MQELESIATVAYCDDDGGFLEDIKCQAGYFFARIDEESKIIIFKIKQKRGVINHEMSTL